MNEAQAITQPEPSYSKTKILFVVKKVVALTLIINAFIVMILAIKDIFTLTKYLEIADVLSLNQLQLEVFKKAVIISSSLFIDSLYGFSLLIKPSHKTKLIHVILGIIIFMISKVIFKLHAIDQILENTRIMFIS